MSDRLEWHALHQMNFGPLNDYVEDWKSTNKKIKSHNEDVDGTVIPGLESAFGGLKETKFSAGGEAALARAKQLGGYLEDAHTEGKAVKTIVADAIEELKPYRDRFREKVDDIESTKGPLDTDGKYNVDLVNEEVRGPAEPDLDDWDDIEKHGIDAPTGGWDTADSPLSVWRSVVDQKIREFTQDLNDIAEGAYEADDEASALLYGASANATEKFNGNADEEVEEASKEEQEKDAEEVEDRLSDGEITEEDIEFANQKMKEHDGEEHFAVSLMDELGPKGLAEVYGQAAVDSPASGKEMDKFQKYLGTTLATATDPDNDGPHLGEDYVEEFQNQGAETFEFETEDGETVSASGYQILAPIFENGTYSKEFLTPIAEDMIQMDASGYGWSAISSTGGNDPENPFNIKHPSYVNPVNSLLVGLGHSPEASLELFSKDPALQEDRVYPGHEAVVPDSYLDYLMERDSLGARAGDEIALDAAGLNNKCIGAAFESAATGMAYDKPTDPAPEHTPEMVAFTKDLISTIGKDSSMIDGDHATLDGIQPSLADITANYIADFYQSQQSEYDPDVHTWIPESNGTPLGMFSDKETHQMNEFLRVLGKDPESAAVVAVAAEAAATSAIQGQYDATGAAMEATGALEPYSNLLSSMDAGSAQEIFKEYEKLDKDNNATVKLVSDTLKTVTSAGISIQNPLAGGLANQFVGSSIDAFAKEFETNSKELALDKFEMSTMNNADDVYSWAFNVYYNEISEDHPDWPPDKIRGEADSAAALAKNYYETQLGLDTK